MSPAEPSESMPLDAARYAWPTASLDPVERMRVLAAGLPHVAANETVFDVGFDRLWSFIADLETNTPRFEAAVGHAQVLERHPEDASLVPVGAPPGERLVLDTRGPLFGPRMRFDVVLRPGWCLMSTRLGQVGMAARPEDAGRTRFFHFEGSAVLGRLLKPVFAWNIRQDFRKLRGLL